MTSSGAAGGVLQQVNQLWSMLDNLCENDPKAYSRFIHRQVEEAVAANAPPQLYSCISTWLLEPEKRLLYINICSWKRVPAPEEPKQPVPLYAGKLETETEHSQGSFSVVDIAFNPGVLEENKDDKSAVYLLALRFVQQHHGLKLSEQYSVISYSPRSSQTHLHRRLGFQQRTVTPEQPSKDSETPSDLLRQIETHRSEQQNENLEAHIMTLPKEQTEKKKNFIQVISTTFQEPVRPQHQLEVKTDAAGVARSVELTVELPKVGSMSECQLTISKDDILLEVEDVYHLLVEFPKPVNEDTAAFNSGVLVVLHSHLRTLFPLT
ncbi:PIH1 domain-containing protein 2 [Cynoglossus semilaevis]|uniref:PIH1 domain-containing protein 2 n=1 Tax=Cynoglossus semilaevis TaxID=244447 RepID=UPI000496EA7F|nr:PIH1 domain-containing protein 2 [Cynoglossus semilaevis]